MMRLTFALIAAIAIAGDSAGAQVAAQGAFSDRIVRLPSGDSAEWQATHVIRLPKNRERIVVIDFFPFRNVADTAALHRQARELFAMILPEIRKQRLELVILHAYDVRGAQRPPEGYQPAYGFAFRQRDDGHWYENGVGPRADRELAASRRPSNDR